MAQAWYSNRVVQTGQVPSTQTNFPALVLLNDARYKTIGNGGHVANASGYDIRFYSDAALTTALTFERVTYDASAGTGEFWVLIASLADAVTIYIGYGDASLTTDGSSTATWPSAYKGVYHQPNGSALTVLDSTSGAINGTNHSATAATGQIDGAAGFNGSTQYVDLTNSATLNPTAAMALETWVSFASNSARMDFFQRWENGSGAGNELGYLLSNLGGTTTIQFYISPDGINAYGVDSTIHPATNTPYHIVAGWDGTSQKIWVNGVLKNTATPGIGSIFSTSRSTKLGRGYEGGDDHWFSGWTDESRILNVLPTNDNVTSKFNNQSNNPAFWPDGTEVAVGGGGSIVPILMNSYRQRRAA